MRIRDWSSDVCSSDLPDRVDLKDYPAAATERIIDQRHYRRDPIIRGSPFAGGAFLWSDIHNFMQLDRRDRASFELGRRDGLNEGITVPYVRLGACMGSCTFAGMRRTERPGRLPGPARVDGIGTGTFGKREGSS